MGLAIILDSDINDLNCILFHANCNRFKSYSVATFGVTTLCLNNKQIISGVIGHGGYLTGGIFPSALMAGRLLAWGLLAEDIGLIPL